MYRLTFLIVQIIFVCGVSRDLSEDTTDSSNGSLLSVIPIESLFVGHRNGFECRSTLCLDLASVPLGIESLTVSESMMNGNSSLVIGMIVSTGLCSLRALDVRAPILLHRNIGQQCTNLTSITMTGEDWDCRWPEWSWLESWEEEKDGRSNVQRALCNKTQVHTNCSKQWKLHNQIICSEQIVGCHPCQCGFSEIKSSKKFAATVDCSSLGLEERDIPPHIPMNADNLIFSNNSLRDVSDLMLQASQMKYLGSIILSDNKLTALPRLHPHHISPRKLWLFLRNNSITDLLDEGMDTYLEQEHLTAIDITLNPLKCGCDFYYLSLKLQEHNKNWTVLQMIPDFVRLTCKDKSLPRLYADENCRSGWYLMPDGDTLVYCVIFIIVLLIAVCVCLIIDTQLCISDLRNGRKDPRIPRIHVITTTIGSFISRKKGKMK